MLPVFRRIPDLNPFFLKAVSAGVCSALFILLILCTSPLNAEIVREAHTEVELVTESAAFVPGAPVFAAVRLAPEQGWHTYWKNPGDTGMASTVKWNLPEGFSAADLQWPVPEKIETPAGVSYGYEGEIYLLTRIETPAEFSGKAVPITAEVRWVVCDEVCIWGKAELNTLLPAQTAEAGDAPAPNELFTGIRKKIPGSRPELKLTAKSAAKEICLSGEVPADLASAGPFYFYSADKGLVDYGAPQKWALKNGRFELRIRRSANSRGAVSQLKGVLAAAAGGPAGSAAEVDLAL